MEAGNAMAGDDGRPADKAKDDVLHRPKAASESHPLPGASAEGNGRIAKIQNLRDQTRSTIDAETQGSAMLAGSVAKQNWASTTSLFPNRMISNRASDC